MTTYPAAPAVPPGSCSLPVDENLPGTAATVRRWVLLEHPGGWGKDILDGSVFGEQLSAALATKMADAGARLLLIRRPGRKGQEPRVTRRAFVAETGGSNPAAAQLFAFEVKSAEDLLGLSLENPQNIPSAVATREVLTLICTHSKRDRCCAVRGRPIAAFLDEQLDGGSVWECSHTGGHRFAPVGLLMPSGLTYGQLTFESALAAAREAAENRVSLTGLRGRSSLTGPEQVAEVAVRQLLADAGQAPGTAELTCSPGTEDNGVFSVKVTHPAGRAWQVTSEKTELPPRPASCGKEPGPAVSCRVLSALEL